MTPRLPPLPDKTMLWLVGALLIVAIVVLVWVFGPMI
jgi:hypothetical protein